MSTDNIAKEIIDSKIAEKKALDPVCVGCNKPVEFTEDLNVTPYCINQECVRYGLAAVITLGEAKGEA